MGAFAEFVEKWGNIESYNTLYNENMEDWYFAFLAVSIPIFWLFAVVFICIWKKRVYSRKPTKKDAGRIVNLTLTPNEDYAETMCSCFDKPAICAHACFFTPCRVVDTYVTLDLITREIAPFVVFIILCCGPYIFGCLVNPIMHTQVRAALGGKKGLGLGDLCKSWFCQVCTISQQARAADKAMNAETKFCCSLREFNSKTPVGQPIKIVADYVDHLPSIVEEKDVYVSPRHKDTTNQDGDAVIVEEKDVDVSPRHKDTTNQDGDVVIV